MKKNTTTKSEFSDVAFSSSDIYLIFYNAFQFLGWCIIFLQTVSFILFNGLHFKGLWAETNICLKIFQTLAVLEVIHVMIGIVRSNVMTTAVQIFSRLFITWPICSAVQASQMSLGLPLILLAWSITEIIRYSFYFLNIVKMAPSLLIYLRYTLFIGLYPMGVLGEQLCMFSALPYIVKGNMFTVAMPNRFNFTFNFYYICILLMLMYIPVFPQLYLHMFSQRRKLFGKDEAKATASVTKKQE